MLGSTLALPGMPTEKLTPRVFTYQWHEAIKAWGHPGPKMPQ